MCDNLHRLALCFWGHARLWGTLEAQKFFLKSDGHPILNASLVSELLEAILLPDEVAICKCAAHTNDKSFISTGNARADAAAKAAAAQETKETTCALVSVTNPDISPCLQSMQTFFHRSRKTTMEVVWLQPPGGGVWMSVDDIPCLPKHFFQHYAKLTHGLDHVSKGSMIMQMKELWFTKGFTVFAEHFCKRCVTCNTHNVARGIKTPLASQPAPAGPFEYLMMDFIELTPCGKQKHCLVMVDMWSKWVEAFPTSKQDSAAVAKALLTEIVPRWGIPRKISSDNGRHFVNDAIKQVGQFLGIDMRTHCSYAPSSGGAVERQNQTIKNKLAKCCEETGLTWLKALPIVLMYMRMRKRVKTNLSPFEILFGRPPFMGIEGGKQGLPSTDVCENDMLNYCKEISCLLSNISVQVKAEGCWDIPARGQTWWFRGDSWSQEKELEIEKVAWAFPGASGDAHGGEGRREGYVGSRKPLQEGAAHCGGGAIAGRGSTRVSINAKIQFEKPLHCSCVFRRNQISAARRRLRGGGNFDCATGIWVDTVINRTDKTLSVSKTVLSHILWS